MFDSLTNSADGLFILLYIIALIVFFLFGPHKVYESIFWCLLGLWLYLFIHEITFVFPEITRTAFFWNWIVENRGSLLWTSKLIAVLLFFITPMTLWLNVSWVVRGTVWFFLKTIVLSALFICVGIVLFSLLSTGPWVFWEVTILPKALKDIPYFQKSFLYSWITNKSSLVLLWAFILGFYKIIFSHWVNSIFLFWGIAYMKWSSIFSKKPLDMIIPSDTSHDEGHDDNWHHGV